MVRDLSLQANVIFSIDANIHPCFFSCHIGSWVHSIISAKASYSSLGLYNYGDFTLEAGMGSSTFSQVQYKYFPLEQVQVQVLF